MDFYQWYYDIPTPIKGVVLAEGETEAKNKVVALLKEELDSCSEQLLYIRWLNPVTDEICVFEDM